jgi:hypothetical protein
VLRIIHPFLSEGDGGNWSVVAPWAPHPVVVAMNREAWRGAIAPLMERAVHHSGQREKKTPKQSSFRTPVRATVDY